MCEIATGEHPLLDYPLGFSTQGTVQYTPQDLAPLPQFYPKSFRSIVSNLLRGEVEKRLTLSEAMKQLKLCCPRKKSVVGDLQEELGRVKQERDLATVGGEERARERERESGEGEGDKWTSE